MRHHTPDDARSGVPLTLEEVQQQRFRMARRTGYEVAEVDAFLDRVQAAFARGGAGAGLVGETAGAYDFKDRVLEEVVLPQLGGAELLCAVAGRWQQTEGVLFLTRELLAFQPADPLGAGTSFPLDRLTGGSRLGVDTLRLDFGALPPVDLDGADAELGTFLRWLGRVTGR